MLLETAEGAPPIQAGGGLRGEDARAKGWGRRLGHGLVEPWPGRVGPLPAAVCRAPSPSARPTTSTANLLVMKKTWNYLGSATTQMAMGTIIKEAIMKPLDHKNLDLDVPYFADIVRWVTVLLYINSRKEEFILTFYLIIVWLFF